MNLLDSNLASKMDNKSHSFSKFLCERTLREIKISHLESSLCLTLIRVDGVFKK